jgi:hypothetical protein
MDADKTRPTPARHGDGAHQTRKLPGLWIQRCSEIFLQWTLFTSLKESWRDLLSKLSYSLRRFPESPQYLVLLGRSEPGTVTAGCPLPRALILVVSGMKQRIGPRFRTTQVLVYATRGHRKDAP